MKFLEDGDYQDFDDEEEIELCTCHECGGLFEIVEGEEPDRCPVCGIQFLPEGAC